mmetsp:Transcript_56395/g.64386  ORF Transcript_56395/g.64386 Transcript_56395/m.64386 type:complete len:353 (+) Transcript_56395:65-1123(+)
MKIIAIVLIFLFVVSTTTSKTTGPTKPHQLKKSARVTKLNSLAHQIASKSATEASQASETHKPNQLKPKHSHLTTSLSITTPTTTTTDEAKSKALTVMLFASTFCLLLLLIIWTFTGKALKFPRNLLTYLFVTLLLSNGLAFFANFLSKSDHENEMKVIFVLFYYFFSLSVWFYLGYYYAVLRVFKGHGINENIWFVKVWVAFGASVLAMFAVAVWCLGEKGDQTQLWWSFLRPQAVGVLFFVVPALIVAMLFVRVTVSVGAKIMERVEMDPEFADCVNSVRMLLPGFLSGLALLFSVVLFFVSTIDNPGKIGNWLFVSFPIMLFFVYGLKSHKMEEQDPEQEADQFLFSKE